MDNCDKYFNESAIGYLVAFCLLFAVAAMIASCEITIFYDKLEEKNPYSKEQLLYYRKRDCCICFLASFVVYLVVCVFVIFSELFYLNCKYDMLKDDQIASNMILKEILLSYEKNNGYY